MKIRQEDISNASISFSRVESYAITTTNELNVSLSRPTATLGYSTAFSVTRPLQINRGNTVWDDIQNWSIDNVSLTTVFPIVGNVSTTVGTLSTTTTIVAGDLIGQFAIGAWSAAPNVSVSYTVRTVSFGSQNSLLNVATVSLPSQSFNGSAWVLGYVASRDHQYGTGFGTNSAGVATGSSAGITTSDNYNGIVWTTSGNMLLSRNGVVGLGSQNGGLITGGNVLLISEFYNANVWQAAPSTLTATLYASGVGTQNAGFVVGGSGISAINGDIVTQSFNGSSWANSGVLNVRRSWPAAFGSLNAALVSGGSTRSAVAGTDILNSEIFNGSSWATSSENSIAKTNASAGGGLVGGLVAGGNLVAGVAQINSEFYNSTAYHKITKDHLKSASNVGIAHNITYANANTTCSVKFSGYIGTISVTSNNAIVAPGDASWVGTWFVAQNYNVYNDSITTNPSATVMKPVPEAEDFVIGYNISRTQMIVLGNQLNQLSIQNGKW